MTRVDAITKRDFPTMSRVLYDFEQAFGPTERIAMIEGGNRFGEPSAGEYVQPVIQHEREQNAELGGGKYLGRDFLRVYGEREGSLRSKKRSKV